MALVAATGSNCSVMPNQTPRNRRFRRNTDRARRPAQASTAASLLDDQGRPWLRNRVVVFAEPSGGAATPSPTTPELRTPRGTVEDVLFVCQASLGAGAG